MAVLNNVETLIRYFNEKTAKRFKFGNAENSSIIEQCLAINPDLSKAFKFINEWIAQGNDIASNNCLINCFRDYAVFLADEKSAVPEAPVQNTSPEAALGAIDLLSKVVTDLVAQTAVDKVEDSVKKSLTSFVDEYIKNTYGPIVRRVEVEFKDPQFKAPEGEVVHEKFVDIFSCVEKGIPVFLTGPAGSGKNHVCKQIATALNTEFYYQSQVMQPYEVTGYTDAMGVYQ